MKGSDLRCDCGAGAADMAPDIELGVGALPGWGVQWTCTNGHQQISGVRDTEVGFESMRFGDEP